MIQELSPENRIVVAEQLRDPHSLVAEAQTVLGKAKRTKEGLLQRLDRRCLDIRISPELLDRALRIMDALLKSLEDLLVEARRRRCQVVEAPLPSTLVEDKPGPAQVRQVPRCGRLRDRQHGHEVANAERAVPQQVEYPGAGGVRERSKHLLDGNGLLVLGSRWLHHICSR